MPQTIWNGDISFGLVSVGIKLIPATKSKDVSFHQLDKQTGSRIKYRKVSSTSGEEVSSDQIVKGYEIEPDEYVLVEPEELEAMAPTSSHKIDIDAFVDLGDIDPIYFENPYYVIPDKKSGKPYSLLVEAMEKMQKVAIGRMVMRTKEYLVAIRPLDGLLCIETMRFADEIVARDNLVPKSEEEPTKKEAAMARQIIESLSEEFEPKKYGDRYREQLLDLIQRKAAGEQIVAAPREEEQAEVVDLMAALEASLEKAKAAKKAASG